MGRSPANTRLVVAAETGDGARSIADALPVEETAVRVETTAEGAVDAVVSGGADCVVAGGGERLDPLAVLERVRAADETVPVVLFPATGDEGTASAAVAAGATDYVPRAGDGERGGVADLADSVAAILEEPEAAPTRRRDLLERRQATLVDLATDDAVVEGAFEEALVRITETAAEVMGVARVNVWLFEDDGRTLRCVDGYDRRTDAHESGTELDAERYPTYFGALKERRSVEVVDAFEDPRTAELDAYLREHDVGALLDATLRLEGEVAGVVCHEHTGGSRRWTAEEVGFAGEVADIVHRALRNRHAARRRERLAYRESFLTAQQEAAPGATLLVDDEGTVVSHDEGLRDLLDLSPETLSSGRDAVLSGVESRIEGPDDEVAAVLSPDDTAAADLRTTDGRIVAAYTAPVVDDGRRYGRLWRFRDVTDRRRRDREHERKHRAIEEAPIGITIAGEDGDDNPILYANARFASLTGYDVDEIEGRDCRLLQGEDTDPEKVARLREAIDRERSTTVELRNYRADGTAFWNRVTIAPIRDDDGDVDHYVGFQEDVTDRKRHERELRESQRRFQAVFDDPNILVALLSPDGDVIEVNRTAMRFLDADREAVAGCRFAETPWFAGDEALQREIRELIDRAADGEYASFEFDHTTAIGETLIAAGAIRPVTDEDGTVVSLLVSARDVTERKRRDRQLDALDRVLRHNLHNEMNVVLGNAGSIVDAGEGPVVDMAEAVIESGERLLELTAKQRRIVRLLSEAPDVETVDLSGTLNECLGGLRDRHPDAEVAVDAPESVRVRAIPHLESALVELVENAVVHGAAPVAVDVETTDDRVCVRIADGGPGIPDEERAILLGEGERGPLYHGNGMGLWLVNWVVDYSEGTIDYERVDGRTVVEVSLRRAED